LAGIRAGKPYEAILFDFDGVLADTEPLHFESWAEALKPLGISLDWQTFEKHCIGIPDRVVAEFFRGLVHPPADFEAVWERHPVKRALFLAKLRGRQFFLPEVPALLSSLKGYQLGVVSASSRLEVEAALEAAGIRHCFEVLIGTEDVERTKPAPDPYLLAMRRLGAGRALAVEDSEAGVASATAAGLAVLRVPRPSDMPGLLRSRLRGG
jgi:HAD superfamily hydrolase (TIGR01509 family)